MHLVGFYCKNISRCTVHWMSNESCLSFCVVVCSVLLASKASFSNLLLLFLLLLLWKGATTVIVVWTARKQLTISGKPDLVNCCAFLWYIQFTNLATSSITQPGRRRVGDPRSEPITSLRIPLAKVDAMLYMIHLSVSFTDSVHIMRNLKLRIILLPKPIFTPSA